MSSRSRCHLEAGQPQEALQDAKSATRLCCRAASGWLLLADAAEACGEAETAEAARDEHEWLAYLS